MQANATDSPPRHELWWLRDLETLGDSEHIYPAIVTIDVDGSGSWRAYINGLFQPNYADGSDPDKAVEGLLAILKTQEAEPIGRYPVPSVAALEALFPRSARASNLSPGM